MEANIFLSYRVADTGSVEKGGDGTAAKLADYLRSLGHTVFFDVENLEGGDRWKDVSGPMGGHASLRVTLSVGAELSAWL